MERKSPGWLSNELLRLDDHKRAVREESRACVHVWGAQTKEKDSLNVYLSMHICAHVCVRDSGGYRKKPCPKSARLMAWPAWGWKGQGITRAVLLTRLWATRTPPSQRQASKWENESLSFTFYYKQFRTLNLWLVPVCPRVDKEGREGGTCFLSMPEFERVKK